MSGTKKPIRLAKAARNINVGIDTITEHLRKRGFEVENKPTTKLTSEMYDVLLKDFKTDLSIKERASQINFRTNKRDELSNRDKKKNPTEQSNESAKIDLTQTISQDRKNDILAEKKDPIESVVVQSESVDDKVPEVEPPVVEKQITEEQKTAESELTTTVDTEGKSIVVEELSKEESPIEAEAIEEENKKTETENTVEKITKPTDEEPPVIQEELQDKSTTVEEVNENLPKKDIEQLGADKEKSKNIVEKETTKEKESNNIESEPVTAPKEKQKKDASDKTVKEETTKEKKETVKKTAKKERKKKRKSKRKTQPKIDLNKEIDNVDATRSEGRSIDSVLNIKKKQDDEVEEVIRAEVDPEEHGVTGPKVIGKIDLESLNMRTRPERKKKKRGKRGEAKTTNNTSKKSTTENTGSDDNKKRRRRRKRIVKASDKDPTQSTSTGAKSTLNKDKKSTAENRERNKKRRLRKRGDKFSSKNEQTEVTEQEIQDKIKATMAKLSGGGKAPGRNRSKIRRQKREDAAQKREAAAQKEQESNAIQVAEFITVSELASLMDISSAQIITLCFNMGIVLSINQRLDAEVIELVAEEFNFTVEFISVTEEDEVLEEEEDAPEDLRPRSPIVTIMGHVDHGKTSLLDYIRNASVVAGEVGGITQHIGAYEVTTEDNKKITFLDTPGHEAFTAMRARGAKVTDIAVIVIAADDRIMPQTKEAISHAQAAGVPMIFAINKVDKSTASPDKIKEQLSQMNLLVEDWGGEYQSADISAKTGQNIDDLLEKILLEAELLELKANPDRKAIGTIIEASLDKGRGYVATVLVQKGTLSKSDIVIAGQYNGRVRAMFNERGKRVKKAGPSVPVMLLGLSGAPQAGDVLRVVDSEQEAREIANRRQQIMREQMQRASKHITLEEIGRRLKIGNFQELNLIVKGDVDGSVEALSDSLLKLSTEEIQIRIVHRAVGAITESDVLLATASDAIIIGFQVRPTSNARKQAEQENIDIRLYSIIYDAINEIKSAMEGMLQPTVEERFVCNVEVRDVFKISKVGTVAGCYVTDGKVMRDTKIRLIRDGIVIYTGEISGLKRFKEDVKEVPTGMECGVSIKNYNDIKVGDIIEGYEEVEIKRTLS